MKKSKKLKELISSLEIDKEAHAQGLCSFPSVALCAAEEQRIKMELLKCLKEKEIRG